MNARQELLGRALTRDKGTAEEYFDAARKGLKPIKPDVSVIGSGPMTTVYLFDLHTQAARDWWAEHVADGPSWGGSKAVEHRYAGDIALGMQADGLIVE